MIRIVETDLSIKHLTHLLTMENKVVIEANTLENPFCFHKVTEDTLLIIITEVTEVNSNQNDNSKRFNSKSNLSSRVR